MSTLQVPTHVERMWDDDVMPALTDYIRIPCQSPAFDRDWESTGFLEQAAKLLADWTKRHLRDDRAAVEIVRLPGRTPTLFVEVPGDAPGTVLIYGHFDKQPPMPGWIKGRCAWAPSLEGERLYGRGGADDGYAIFSAVVALSAARTSGAELPRCVILIEGCEESGSDDLPAYVDHLAPRLGAPDLVVALDAYCGNYDQLWTTTSVRGQVAGALCVSVLTEGAHSGDASGAVPSSFRVARQLLSRLEDAVTGEILPKSLHAAIPVERRRQAATTAAQLGRILFEKFPRTPGLKPVDDDMAELALNCAWRPQLAITGIDGLPSIANAAAVMAPSTALKLSVRLPPTVDPDVAAQDLKTLLESDPPYGAQVSFDVSMISKGWHAPATAAWLEESLERASREAFGAASAQFGGGGGIPFLSMLGERFPETQFVVTGVLGPGSNAHGPNEYLHLPTAKRVTVALTRLLIDLARNAGVGSDKSRGHCTA